MNKIVVLVCFLSATVSFASTELTLSKKDISRVDGHTLATLLWVQHEKTGGSLEVGSCSLHGFSGFNKHLAFDIAGYLIIGDGYETAEEAYKVADQFITAVKSGKCEK